MQSLETEMNEDVDVNLDAADEEITIDQTAVAGTANVPLIGITDARTGATANTAGEATLMITAEGTHAVNVAKGITAVLALTATTADADSLTVDAGGVGVTVQSAGELALGKTTATTLVLGSSAVTSITLTTDGTGTGEVVLPALSIGDAEIAAVAVGKITGGVASTNFTFLSATATTGRIWIANGCITNVTQSGE